MAARRASATVQVLFGWACALLVVAGLGLVVWVSGLPGAEQVTYHGGVAAAALAAVWAFSGALLVTARPANSVGWLLVLVGVLQAHANVGIAYGGYGVGVASPQWPLADWVAQSASMIYLPSLVLPVSVILAVYPDGRLPSRRWRVPVGMVAVGLTILTVGASLTQEAYDDLAPGKAPVQLKVGPWATAIGVGAFVALLAGTLAIWVLTGIRLVRTRPPARQQLAWYVCLVLPALLWMFFGNLAGLWAVALGLSIPLAIAVGVVRYRLLGIVLSRGLMFAILTAAVVAVYVGVTALAGARLDHGPVPGVVAAALVAVGLTPARERVQRGVDRFVYGERGDPIRAVTGLGHRIATQSDLLPATLAGVVAAMRASHAAVLRPDGAVIAGQVVEPADRLELSVAGAHVGALVVTWRSPTEPYSRGDRRLLAALAPQVGVAVQAADLTRQLQAERDRVLDATRTERDRYRRDMHDELGPSLSGVGLSLQVACDALDVGETATARRMIEAAHTETGRSVEEVRRIIDDLRPGVLDECGLAEAVRRHALTIAPALHVQVRADTMPPMAPDVETAVYRIAREALTNVVRHAHAHQAHVDLRAESDTVILRVTDDGQGMDRAPRIGDPAASHVGLASMSHRAQALGGTVEVTGSDPGTVVTARVPLGAPQ